MSRTADSADHGRENPWHQLAEPYEYDRASRESLDSVLEWPAQLSAIGDVRGLEILDVGCGSGMKSLELAKKGALHVTGIDISDAFKDAPSLENLRFLQADLSYLDEITELQGCKFDLVLFLQSLGYAKDEVRSLRVARRLLKKGGAVIVARSSPMRYAMAESQRIGVPMGRAYHQMRHVTYMSEWETGVEVSHRVETFSRMVNNLCLAGFAITSVAEPYLDPAQAEQFPQHSDWMDHNFGIVIFRAVASPAQSGMG